VYIPAGTFCLGVEGWAAPPGFGYDSGDRRVFMPLRGRRYFNNPLYLPSGTRIRGEERGRTTLRLRPFVRQWGFSASVFVNEHHNMRWDPVVRDTDIAISGLTIDGSYFSNPAGRGFPARQQVDPEGVSGLAFSRVDGLSLSDLDVRNCQAWGMSLSQDGDNLGDVTDVHVSRVVFADNRYHGLGIVGPLTDVVFEECAFQNNKYGCDIEIDTPFDSPERKNRDVPLNIEKLEFRWCWFANNEDRGFLMQPGLQTTGSVSGLLLDHCVFMGNGTAVHFTPFSTIKYKDPATFRNCWFLLARQRAAYIEGGHGTFDRCHFKDNHDEKRDPGRTHSSDINFFAMDIPPSAPWLPFRANSDLEWSVSRCEFLLSSRQLKKGTTDVRNAGDVREAITVGLVAPIAPTGAGDSLILAPRVFRDGVGSGKVRVTVEGCTCDTSAVQPPDGEPNRAVEAVFIRTHVAGSGPTKPGGLIVPDADHPNLVPNTSTRGARDWEWVENPGDPRTETGATRSRRFT